MNVEQRKQAVLRARRDGVTLTELAGHIGTTGANLSELMRRGSGRSKFVPILDRWLQVNGYWDDEQGGVAVQAQAANNIPEACKLLSSELHSVADAIGSPLLPIERKRDRWLNFISTFGDIILNAVGVVTTATCDTFVTPIQKNRVKKGKGK